MIKEEVICDFDENRSTMRDQAKEKLLKVQQENRKTFDSNRKPAQEYDENDLVAIQRTQYGPGLKIHTPFLGSYKITKVLGNHRYIIEKIGEHEGPNVTRSAADYMKPWIQPCDFIDDIDEDASVQDGRL